MELHEIFSVTETNETGVYVASVDITDMAGERYTCDYVSREGDTFGLAPIVRSGITEWIANGSIVAPYVIPAIIDIQVDIERDRRITETFAFNTTSYQLDAASQQNIIAKGAQAKFAILAGAVEGDLRWANPDADFGWIATDNTVIPMDAQTMSAFADAADLWVTAHIMAARTIKNLNPIPQDYTSDTYWP